MPLLSGLISSESEQPWVPSSIWFRRKLIARNVVPVIEIAPLEYRLDRTCLIEHMTGNCVGCPESPFAKIDLDDMFE